MQKQWNLFIGLALAIGSPVSAYAVTLEPFVADTVVAFDGVKTEMDAVAKLSAVARIDPITGERGQSGLAVAVARQTGLATTAISEIMGGDGTGPARTFVAASEARMRAFDLVLTDETGTGATETSISLSFLFEGFLSISGANNDGRSFVSSTLNIDYGLGQGGPGGTGKPTEIGRLRLSSFPNGFGDAVKPGTGVFEDLDYGSSTLISEVITTPVFSVPLDTELSFQIAMFASAGGTSNGGDALQASSSFGHTLSFFTDNFFNLQDGVSASSASLGLVDNSITVSAVPVPPALGLFTAAVAFISTFSMRRRGAEFRLDVLN